MTGQNKPLNIFQIVAEFSSDWLMLLSVDKSIEYISPAVEDITGYAPQDFIDDENLFVRILHPEDKERVMRKFERQLTIPRSCSVQFRIIHKNGSIRHIEHLCRPVFDDKSRITGRVSNNRDITSRVKCTGDILDMACIVDQSAEAVAITDTKANINYVNPAFEKVTGYSLAEVKGQNPRILKSNEHKPQFYRKMWASLARGKTWRGQFINKKKNGGIYYEDVAIFPIKDDTGKIIRYAKIARDVTKHKEMEIALYKQKEILETLINSTPDIICFKDGCGRWLKANEADLKLFELENVDYQGKTDMELAEYSSFYRNAFMECIKSDEFAWTNGKMFRAIEVIHTRDGLEKIYDVIKKPIFNKDGSRMGLVVLGRDITEAKKAENALLNNMKLLKEERDLFTIGPVVVFKWKNSPGWPVEYVSKNVKQIFGYDEKEFLEGKISYFELVHEEDISKFNIEIKEGSEGEKSRFAHQPYRVIRKDGKITWLYNFNAVLRNSENEITHYLGYVIDITELILAQQALNESEEKFRRLFEESLDIIFISSSEGEFLDMNPAGLKAFGYSSLEEIQKIDIASDLFKNYDDRIKYLNEINKAGFVKDYELLLKKKDGSEIIVLETTNAIYDDNGNIVVYRGIMRDITEKRKLEKQLAQAQKMESLGTLAGGVAHDFNNLLTVINGYAEMALMRIGTDNPLHKDINAILSAGKRAENLTSQLLAFSRKQIYKVEILSINQVISSIDKMLRRLIGEDIHIERILADNLPNIKADKSQLAQIFINLIVNARDAINSVKKQNFQKKITIETGQAFLDKEYVAKHQGSTEGLHVFFAVSDNGIGMDEEVMGKIFEPFFTTKGKYKGTGLGLSMVYGIVKQNHSSIYVYSEPGEGTMFKIYWPATEGKIVVSDKSFKEKSLYGRENILVVEDEEDVCRFASDSLMALGYNVHKASNGSIALELIKHKGLKVDLIITDLIMPELNGKEFIKKVREIYPDIKVIYVSGYTDNHIVHNGLLEEGVNFIHKPYSIKTLASTIRKILDAK